MELTLYELMEMLDKLPADALQRLVRIQTTDYNPIGRIVSIRLEDGDVVITVE